MNLNQCGISRSEADRLIEEWIFNKRNAAIMKRRLDGLTYERLAEEFDLSVQQIKNIVYKSQDTLSCHL